MDQGSTKKRSTVHNFIPTVTKFCVVWEGLSLPQDKKFGNCRDEICDRRVIFIWSLIHGSSWSGLIKVGPGGNQPVTDGFPPQRASNAERVSMSWHHHELCAQNDISWDPYWITAQHNNLIKHHIGHEHSASLLWSGTTFTNTDESSSQDGQVYTPIMKCVMMMKKLFRFQCSHWSLGIVN